MMIVDVDNQTLGKILVRIGYEMLFQQAKHRGIVSLQLKCLT